MVRQESKPPESIDNSLAVYFVGLGRNLSIYLAVVGLRENLKSHHIQIFGGNVMHKSQAPKIFFTNLEKWAKNRPIKFLTSPQEHRRGVSA